MNDPRTLHQPSASSARPPALHPLPQTAPPAATHTAATHTAATHTATYTATRYTATRYTATILVGSLFVALCAHIAVPLPWTPIPMTMQPFAVLLLGLLLGPTLGAATLAAYLLEGAAGLPVFVPGFGGLLPLGPSAGYLLSYPAVAALTGLLWRRGQGFLHATLAAALGSTLILLSGASWLALATHVAPLAAARYAILPFLGGDTLKALLAAALATQFSRIRSRARPL